MCDKAVNGVQEAVHATGVAVDEDGDARAPTEAPTAPPPKKRKTRRGKSKRQRNAQLLVHPYRRNNGSKLPAKAEAPYNSNRFLIEDHGVDAQLMLAHVAPASTSATRPARTRDSSFSLDSEGEFYSTPDDEEVFLIKDFDDQYESVQAERLQGMSKDELVKEYLALEGRVELLTKRLRTKPLPTATAPTGDLQKEVQRLTVENEALRHENDGLREQVGACSGSADSETDSSDTCSSSASSLSHASATNGHCHCVESEHEQAV